MTVAVKVLRQIIGRVIVVPLYTAYIGQYLSTQMTAPISGGHKK